MDRFVVVGKIIRIIALEIDQVSNRRAYKLKRILFETVDVLSLYYYNFNFDGPFLRDVVRLVVP